MDEVKVITAIYCTKKRRGNGVEADPIRIITEVFKTTGELIAENDPEMIFTKKDMVSFAQFFDNRKDKLETPIKTLFEYWKENQKNGY